MALKMELRETIAAPPERVFAALTDVDSLPHWMSGLVRIERLTDGPFGKGTRFREVRKMFGREAAEVFDVVEFDPPRSFALFVDGRNGSSGKGEFRFRHTLAPKGGGTELVLSGEIGGMSRIAEFFGRLMCGFMKKAIARDLAALKAFVEDGPKKR